MPLPAAIPVGATLLEAAGAMFSRLMLTQGGKWVAGILLTLGINIAGGAVVNSIFVSKVGEAMGGIPAEFKDWMGVLQVDVYVSILISAYIVRNVKDSARLSLIKAGRR